MLKIVEKLKFTKVIVLIDRIDEDQRFENDAELIANYTKLILTDEKLLLTPKLQIIFTSWTTPFNFIKQYVRTQKHSCNIIHWSNSDLESVLNNRLKVFSKNKVINYKDLFASDVTQDDLNAILKLANSTPRDLWHIFSNLLRIQYDKDSLSTKIEKSSIGFALSRFVKNFNYFEYYPRKTNARSNSMDVFSYIDLLLKLDTNTFNAKQLKEKNQLQHSTAQSYISNMEKMGLITLSNPDSGSAQYNIKDPKITHAREREIKIYRT
ncbi:P-loop ATPase, Sll1717 family [Acinetobacter portensis]|uniref:P-loop ATPase, Sll1717 family n=1 Tax=Acinetobacter portensis TaxID=1839785 RepID=UPI003D7D3AE2